MKKKSLFAIVMCVVMLFSSTAVFAAGVTTEVKELKDPKMVMAGTVSFTRESALSGRAVLTCSSSVTDLTYIKATITVERLYTNTGEWDQYYTPFEVYGNAEFGSLMVTEYIDVKASGTYRIKVVFEDKKGSVATSVGPVYSYAVSL